MGLALYYGYYSEFLEIIGLSAAAAIGFYFWYRHQIWKRWTDAMVAMGKPEAQLSMDDESFTVSSGAGSATIPWRRCTKLWKQDEYWLLFLGTDYMPMTIPLEGIDVEILNVFEAKVSQKKNA